MAILIKSDEIMVKRVILLNIILLFFLMLKSNAQSRTEVEEFFDTEEYTAGIAYVQKHYNAFKYDARANYLLGEMGLRKKDWEAARKGYERVLSITSPKFNGRIYDKDAEIHWAAIDGLGVVYYVYGDYKKSLGFLETANKLLDKVSVHKLDEAKNYYNLACAYSLNNYPRKAISALEQAINKNPEYLNKAQYENDFESLKDYPTFIDLLDRK